MEKIMYHAIAIIVVVNLVLYFKTLRFKFVSDDYSVWQNPPEYKNAWHKAWLRFIGAAKFQSRSIHFLWYKKRPHIAIVKTEELEHVFALILHTAICVSIYFAFGCNQISFITALLYSTNPINNQGTIWCGGRGYALPILCLLLVMAVPYLAFILLPFCAWFTVGFLAPLALIGSPSFNWFIGFAILTAWGLNAFKFTKAVKNKHATETFDEDRVIHPRKLILGVKTFGFYLFLCLIPFRITFYHNFLQSAAGSMKHKCYTLCRYFWIGLFAITGMITYACLVPWNPITWALFAFCITVAPFCNVIRANQEIAERFVALPNVFLMFAFAQILTPLPYSNMIIMVFLTYYATRTFHTLIMYKDEYYITELAVIEDPHAWWAWHCRAMKRWQTQSYKEALILWVMARLISPNEFKILINIATCLRLLKNDKEADEFIKLAEQNIVAGQEKDALTFIADHKKGKLPILL
jgi:hypothetical protein